MSGRALGAVGAIALLLCAEPAVAQPTSTGPLFRAQGTDAPPPSRVLFRLDFSRGRGAEACPDEQGLRGAVAARLGYDPFAPTGSSSFRVTIARRGPDFVATIERRDPSGRVVWARPPLPEADCSKLVGLMALGLTIEIDPAAAGAHALSPPAELIAPPVHAPPAHVPLPVEPAPAPSVRPSLRLGARAAVAIGAGPATTAAITADVGVGFRFVSFALEGRADVPMAGGADRGLRLRTSLLGASFVPCGHYGWFVGCGVVSVGALRAEGMDVRRPAEGASLYAAAGLRAGIEWPIVAAFALRLSGDALVTVRPVIARMDGSEVWRTPPFAALVGAGGVVRF